MAIKKKRVEETKRESTRGRNTWYTKRKNVFNISTSLTAHGHVTPAYAIGAQTLAEKQAARLYFHVVINHKIPQNHIQQQHTPRLKPVSDLHGGL